MHSTGRVWRVRWSGAPILAAAVALAACGGEGGAGSVSDAMVRDSAGIRVVQNGGPAWAPDEGWRIDPRPLLEVGVLEGNPAEMLDRVRSPLLRSDGVLVLANAGTSQLRAFDPAGTLLWESGRAGEGPGEFQSISSLLLLPGDSVLVWDIRTRRVTVLSPDGAPVRSYLADPPADAPMAAPEGVLDGGRLLISGGVSFSTSSEGEVDEAIWPESPHFVGDREGNLGDRIVTVHTTEMRLRQSPQAVSIGDLPFARRGFAAPAGDRVVTAESPVAALTWRNLEGVVTQVARWSHEPVAVSESLVEAWVGERVADADDPDVQRYYRELVEGVELPRRVPAFTAVETDPMGNVWVARWREPGAQGPAPWWVFGSDGMLLGEVRFPAEFEVSQITRSAVVGITRDDLGVERVRVYSLER